MGKASMLSVIAVLIGTSIITFGFQRTSLETGEVQGDYQEELLARRMAQSGLDMALSKTHRDFDNWRSGYDTTSYKSGTFAVNASGPTTGPVVLTAEGAYGDATYRIETNIGRLAPSPAAVLLNADTALVTLGGSDWVITGRDTPASGTEGWGRGSFVNGVWAKTDGIQTAFEDASSGTEASNIRGELPEHDIISDDLSTDLEAFYSEAYNLATTVYNSDQTFFGSTTIGSPSAPEIVLVKGDATFSGDVKGYGMLLVEGDLQASDNAEWHGLIFAKGTGEMSVSFAGNAKVYGAAYVTHVSGDEDVNVYVGGETFAPLTVWAVDDDSAILHYYALSEGNEFINVEGAIDGIQTDKDVEAFTLSSDGTIYFVNNVGTSQLYKIDPQEFDKDGATPVQATYIGDTGLSAGSSNHEITSLQELNGTLYGIGKKSKKIWQINTSTGAVTQVGTLNINGSFRTDGLTEGSDGTVYLIKTKTNTSELWKFDSFPGGSLTYVMDITGSGKVEALAGHPNGYLYAADSDQWYLLNLTSQSTTVLQEYQSDIEGMDFFFDGESSTYASHSNGSSKVTICHIPPGNPSNAHNITVSVNAMDAHLNHGDVLGDCPTGDMPETCTTTISGTSTDNLFVGAGDVLCIEPTGTVTGGVTIRGEGEVYNDGTLMPSYIVIENGGTLTNGGTVTTGNVSINNDGQYINEGTTTITGGFSPGDGSYVNIGTTTVMGTTNINNNVVFSNYCTMYVQGDLNVNATLNNYSVIEVNGKLQNNGQATINTYDDSRISSISMINDGTITGPSTGEGVITVSGSALVSRNGGGATGNVYFCTSNAYVTGSAVLEDFNIGCPTVNPTCGYGVMTTSSGMLTFALSGNAGVYYSTEAIGKLVVLLPSIRQQSWMVEYDQYGKRVD